MCGDCLEEEGMKKLSPYWKGKTFRESHEQQESQGDLSLDFPPTPPYRRGHDGE